MRTTLPPRAERMHTEPGAQAGTASIEGDLFAVSLDLGVDLVAYADELFGESVEERAARLDAARDMLVGDNTIYLRTMNLVARVLPAVKATPTATETAIWLTPRPAPVRVIKSQPSRYIPAGVAA